jgi:hypothetical protein
MSGFNFDDIEIAANAKFQMTFSVDQLAALVLVVGAARDYAHVWLHDDEKRDVESALKTLKEVEPIRIQ